MGGGSFTYSSFSDYASTKYTSCSVSADTMELSRSISQAEAYKQRRIHQKMNPRKVLRECLNTAEHPNTIPVILALDVTGSMGSAATEVASKIGKVMKNLYDTVPDVEVMIMGIGDLYCDDAPIQIGQFESDTRVCEDLDKLWFENGGGGNDYESYTAAWYMGLNHTKLDCWDQGRRGIIITMGDELCNHYLCASDLKTATDDDNQADIETPTLYKKASEKFDIYHINVNHDSHREYPELKKSWKFLGQNYLNAEVDDIADKIVEIVSKKNTGSTVTLNENNEISW